IQDAEFLIEKGVKLIIAACNTVSAVALTKVQDSFPKIPIFGVLEAGVTACIDEKPDSVTIIGTRATILSDAYRKGIHFLNPSIHVQSIATPLFVPIVEEGLQDSFIAKIAIEMYLQRVIEKPSDVLLLACTHYPLLKKSLSELLPKKIKIIDSAESCAKFTMKKLAEMEMEARCGQKGFEKFYVTDMPGNFYQQAKRFLSRDLEYFEKVSLC
ncbi:MAG TPA: aspartate/glutamate racemase family protein, partial [Victivallales bacterium]|nr:aspartate/glutamate racemase family protein [Victivallales bacterium]